MDINDYPTIKNHLDQFIFRLTKRTSKGNTPYNLRSCKYIDNFYKQKIVWQEITTKPKFFFDESGFIPEASTLIMVGNHIKFLTGFLNSRVSEWYFKIIGTEIGGKFRWKKYTIQKLPVVIPKDPKLTSRIEKLVEMIQGLQEHSQKQKSCNQKEMELQAEIDNILYNIIGLSEFEINLIEQNTSS